MSSFGSGQRSSFPERLLGAALLLLVAALALRLAVHVLISLLLPLLGLAFAGLLLGIGWRYWLSRRGGW